MSDPESHVVLYSAFDARLVVPATVMFTSALAQSDPGARVRVLYSLIDRDAEFRPNLEKSLEAVRPGSWSVEEVVLPSDKLEAIAAPTRVPPVSYARLILAELVPDDRVLYFDPDIVVQRKISPVWRLPLDGTPMAAVADDGIATFGQEYERCRSWGYIANDGLPLPDPREVGMSGDEPYLNSGMLVMNLREFRTHDFFGKAREIMRGFTRHCALGDQSLLNILAKGRWHQLPREDNYQVRSRDLIPDDRMAEINLHFAGGSKPWEVSYLSEGPYFQRLAARYYAYLDLTPYRNRRPSRTIHTYRRVKAGTSRFLGRVARKLQIVRSQ